MGIVKKDFLRKNAITQIGYPPLRIDILSDTDGVQFGQAVKNKQVFKFENLIIPFIGIHDLIKNKETTGREIDIDDLARVRKKSKTSPKDKRKAPGKKR